MTHLKREAPHYNHPRNMHRPVLPRLPNNFRHMRVSQARTEPVWLRCALLRLLALIGTGLGKGALNPQT